MNEKIENSNVQVQKLFKERGLKAVEIARKTVLEEKIESKDVREALRYFIMEYWHDVARPGLLSVTCESVGGNPEATTDVAVPLMVISGATDIHDDIIDESKVKYSRLTVYGKFGKDIALLVGDALFFKGLTMLNKSCAKHSRICDIVKDMFFEQGDAEALELQLRGKTTVLPETYVAIIRKKAADVEAHTRIGAILGGGTEKEVEMLGEYGRLLGMLVLLKDDYVDSLEHEEIKHRILKEHLPLPMLYALENRKVKTTLNPIFHKKDIRQEDTQKVKALVRKANGFQMTKRLMESLEESAQEQIKPFVNNKRLQLMLYATRV